MALDIKLSETDNNEPFRSIGTDFQTPRRQMNNLGWRHHTDGEVNLIRKRSFRIISAGVSFENIDISLGIKMIDKSKPFMYDKKGFTY